MAAPAYVHGAGLSRLFHVRHQRSGPAPRWRRTETGAAAHRLRNVGTRSFAECQVREVGAHGRRRARQIPSARRIGLLRRHGADGAAVLVPLPVGQRPGQLGSAGRSEVLCRHALYGSAIGGRRGVAARRARPRHGGLRAQFRRRSDRAGIASGALADGAVERCDRHRRGHGNGHTAPQPARGGERVHPPHRSAIGHHRGTDAAHPGGRTFPPIRSSPRWKTKSSPPTRPAAARSVPAPGTRGRTAMS